MLYENEKQELLKQFETVNLLKIDHKILSEKFHKEIVDEYNAMPENDKKFSIEKDEVFYINPFGIIQSNDGAYYIDDECIHRKIEDGKFEVKIYSKCDEGFGTFPRFTTFLNTVETITNHSLPISLIDFMGSRFAYNARIINNMMILQKTLNV